MDNSRNLLSASPAGAGRNKVALTPGHSMMDWLRLANSGKDLTGVGGKVLKVNGEELSKHSKEDDAWLCLHGRVYNVTAYMPFHPGGVEELLRGAGKDSTDLFNEVHQWVNYQAMLSKCLVGRYTSLAPKKISAPSLDVTNIVPGVKASSVVQSTRPEYNWTQTADAVVLNVNTNCPDVLPYHVIIHRKDNILQLEIHVHNHLFTLSQELRYGIQDSYKVVTQSGEVEITLTKKDPALQWTDLGNNKETTVNWIRSSEQEIEYLSCHIVTIETVTYNTFLYCVEYPVGSLIQVPPGRHVFVQMNVAGITVSHAYTVVPASLKPSRGDDVSSCSRLYLMVKIYPTGLLTPCFQELHIGDRIEVSSSYAGQFDPTCLGDVQDLILCAAGTGITPMLSLISYCLFTHPKEDRHIKLIFFNRTERDILWYSHLRDLQSTSSSFSVDFVLSQPEADWKGLTGHVNKTLLAECLPSVTSQSFFCACGPTDFTKISINFAKELSFTDNMIFEFAA